MSEHKDVVEVKGISQFFYFGIPAVLGVAAVLWLGFYVSVHDFSRKVTQDNRGAQAVGASPLPKEAFHVTIRNKKEACAQIDSASVEDDALVVYLHNRCPYEVRSVKILWKVIAPDGTVIGANDRYVNGDNLDAGEKVEFREDNPYTLQFDARMSEVVVSMKEEGR